MPKLSDAQAEKILTQISSYAQALTPQFGGDFAAALTHVARTANNVAVARKAYLRFVRTLDIAATRNLYLNAKRFDNYGEGLRAALEPVASATKGSRFSLDYKMKYTFGSTVARLKERLDQAGVWDDFNDGRHGTEILQELGEYGKQNPNHGVSGNQAAVTIAKELAEHRSEIVAMLNRAGAMIRERPGYMLPQVHDTSRIVADGATGGVLGIGAKHSKDLAFQKWSAFIEPLLDPVETFKGEDPKEFLKSVHDNLYARNFDETTPDSANTLFEMSGGLGTKISAERVLHFKDSNSFIQYNERYGNRMVRDAYLNQIHKMSRDLAVLETLGPNYERNFKKAKYKLMEDAKNQDDLKKHSDSLGGFSLQAAFDIATGKADVPGSATAASMAKWQSFFQHLTIQSSQGMTLLSAIPDAAFVESAVLRNGMSSMDLFANAIERLHNGGSETRTALHDLGMGAEAIAGHVSMRHSIHDETSGFMSRNTERLMRWNQMRRWTEFWKDVYATTLARHMGEQAALPHASLPEKTQRLLDYYDISAAEWDILRKTVSNKDGRAWLASDNLDVLSPADQDALKVMYGSRSWVDTKRKIESRLGTMYIDQTDIAVPTPGAAERKWVTLGGRQKGTFPGMVAGFIMMFKSYPITITNKVLGLDIYGSGNKSVWEFIRHDREGMLRLTAMVAMASIAGYVGIAMRDAIQGKTPQKWEKEDGTFNAKLLFDSIQRGGAGGLYTDLLLTGFTRGSKDFSSYVAGPVIGKIADPALDVLTRVETGQPVAGAAYKAALNAMPFNNLIFARQALDHLVLWHLQNLINPGSVEAMERDLKARTGQSYLPSRAPSSQIYGFH